MVPGWAAIQAHQTQAEHLEAKIVTHLPQEVHVAMALMPEVEVLPHHDQSGANAVHEDEAHELLCRLLSPHLVKGHHHGQIYPGGGQLLQLLGRIGQQ